MIYSYPDTLAYSVLLKRDIEDSSLFGFVGIVNENNLLEIEFADELSSNDQIILDGIVSNHLATYPNSLEYIAATTQHKQEDYIMFGRTLLGDWMRRNTAEGMTIAQSLWVFSRFEEFSINFEPFDILNLSAKKVDMFKMFMSGALPTLYACLLQIEPDPMTEDYHWVTQARIDWVKERVGERLGPGMVAYIESLYS